jgi:hypothetical protein
MGGSPVNRQQFLDFRGVDIALVHQHRRELDFIRNGLSPRPRGDPSYRQRSHFVAVLDDDRIHVTLSDEKHQVLGLIASD